MSAPAAVSLRSRIAVGPVPPGGFQFAGPGRRERAAEAVHRLGQVLEAASRNGIGEVWFRHDRALWSAAGRGRAFRGLRVVPIVPNVAAFVREVSARGMAGAGIRRVLDASLSAQLRMAAAGLRLAPRVAARDFPALLRILLVADLGDIAPLGPEQVFLDSLATDLLLAFGRIDVLHGLGEFVRRRFGAELGLHTRNLGLLLRELEEEGSPIRAVMGPVHSDGLGMRPDAGILPGGDPVVGPGGVGGGAPRPAVPGRGRRGGLLVPGGGAEDRGDGPRGRGPRPAGGGHRGGTGGDGGGRVAAMEDRSTGSTLGRNDAGTAAPPLKGRVGRRRRWLGLRAGRRGGSRFPPLTGDVLVSVIVPVYNEEQHIREIVERILAQPLGPGISLEVIAVNDGSQDETLPVLECLQAEGKIRVHNSIVNFGKGAAVRLGIRLARGQVVLIQDGDLEYHPKEYPRLIGPIVSGEADVVYGSRFLGKRVKMQFRFLLANRILTLAANVLYGLRLTDEATGYKVFRREVLDALRLRCIGFEFCPEVTAKAARAGYPILEVPIDYEPRSVLQGKKIRWKDGFKALYALLRYRLGP